MRSSNEEKRPVPYELDARRELDDAGRGAA